MRGATAGSLEQWDFNSEELVLRAAVCFPPNSSWRKNKNKASSRACSVFLSHMHGRGEAQPGAHGLNGEADGGLAVCRLPAGIMSHGSTRPLTAATAAHEGAWGVESARVLRVALPPDSAINPEPPDSAINPEPGPPAAGPLVVVCQSVGFVNYPPGLHWAALDLRCAAEGGDDSRGDGGDVQRRHSHHAELNMIVHWPQQARVHRNVHAH